MQPGRDRPLPEALPSPEVEFRIEAPRRSPVPRAVDEIHFQLKDIRVVGAETLPVENFRPLYEKLIGKDVTLSDILDVADRIEDEYRHAGYPLVRAYVPPQRVSDGIFTIKIVEGFVADISVEGADGATEVRIKAYLEPVLQAKPLTLATIERGLLLANDLPGVTATGTLRPSPDTPGASNLVVTVTQPRITGALAVDNRGSHFTGHWTITGDFALNKLFDNDDQLSGTFATAPDFSQRHSAQLRYRHPIGTNGLLASLIGTYTHGEPGSFLAAIDVITDSWAVGPRLSFPLMRTRAQTVTIDGGISVQDARVDILDERLSHDQWRVADIAVSYARNDLLGGTFSSSLDLAQGLPILGATPDDSPELSRLNGKTDFTKLTGLIRYTRVLGGPVSLALAAQGQYSFDPLIAGEQITFGGSQIGRGYEPGAVTGDHGLGGSVELRYSARLPQLFVTALQPYLFYDAAQVWNIDEPSEFDYSIASGGAGIRLWFPYDIAAAVELARTLDAVPGSDSGHRTTKVLFNAAVRF